jgi:hypothetical protein
MFAALSLDLDFLAQMGQTRAGSVQEAPLPTTYAEGGLLPGNVVTIAGSAYINVHAAGQMHHMTQVEREAMDRAFWRSVQVIDDGFEE